MPAFRPTSRHSLLLLVVVLSLLPPLVIDTTLSGE